MAFPNFLKIATVLYPPFFTLESSGSVYTSYSGVEVRFLEILSDALDFRYKWLITPDGEWGRLKEDGNMTGTVGMVQRHEADMALSFLAVTEQRLQAADFSEYYTSDTIQFVTHIPKFAHKVIIYVYAFQYTVWISSFISLLLVVMALFFVSRKPQNVVNIFMELMGSLLRQPLAIKTIVLSERWIIGFWLFFAFILSSAYMSGLSSFLTLPLKELPVQNFLELAEKVEKGSYKSFVRQGTITLHILKNTEAKHLKLLGEHIEKNQWTLNENSPPWETFDKTSALVLTKKDLIWRYGTKIGKTMYLSDDVLTWGYIAMAVKKGFCCMKKLNSVISKLRESGLYEKFLKDEMFRRTIQNEDTYETNTEELNTIETSIILGIILLSGYSLAFAVLAIEIIYFRLSNFGFI